MSKSLLFKVPRIMNEDDRNESTFNMFKAVVSAAFPDANTDDRLKPTIDGVTIYYIDGNGPHPWHPRFVGIQLSVASYTGLGHRERRAFKRVMMKGGFIDLDEIRTKHAELAKVAKEKKELGDAKHAAESRRMSKVRALAGELRLKDWFLSSGTEDVYSLKLEGLSADDVRELVRLLRGRDVKDVQEVSR